MYVYIYIYIYIFTHNQAHFGRVAPDVPGMMASDEPPSPPEEAPRSPPVPGVATLPPRGRRKEGIGHNWSVGLTIAVNPLKTLIKPYQNPIKKTLKPH